jgi:hypothetical protein
LRRSGGYIEQISSSFAARSGVYAKGSPFGSSARSDR